MSIWNRVEQLKGKTLLTRARQKGFDVVDVLSDRIQFAPKNGKGTLRWLDRASIEQVAEMNLEESELTPLRLKAEFPDDQNLSYMAAIVYAVTKE